jgi:hypothetical protein
MTFTEFNELDLEQKMDAIWEWGFFVGKTVGDVITKVLYSLNGFFAEVSINSADSKIVKIESHHLLGQDLLTTYALSTANPFVRASSNGKSK